MHPALWQVMSRTEAVLGPCCGDSDPGDRTDAEVTLAGQMKEMRWTTSETLM
jgi:hypothetical protein